MKKIIAFTSAFLMSCSALSFSVSAAETESVHVYVTISDGSGKLCLTQEAVDVTDTDGDGVLTINDALYLAHESDFEGGAAAGYAASETQYGLSLMKLWGAENGGSYGYYVNNASPMSLADTVKDGDYINAYVFTDLETYSDTYCFFNMNSVEAKQGDEISLTLSAVSFDENYLPITVPIKGAELSVNGEESGIITNDEGQASIQLGGSGKLVISASSETQNLVPPVCIVNAAADPTVTTASSTTAVSATTLTTNSAVSTTAVAASSPNSSPSTGDKGIAAVIAVFAASAAASFALKRRNEK